MDIIDYLNYSKELYKQKKEKVKDIYIYKLIKFLFIGNLNYYIFLIYLKKNLSAFPAAAWNGLGRPGPRPRPARPTAWGLKKFNKD